MSKPKLLLVGEGDFSFAASEVTKESHTVVASALLGDKLMTESQHKNVQHIKDNGGLVFLDVDATRLSEHADIVCMQFERVQFNFPHIRGKMNIKANRRLVELFFQSCRKLIELGCLDHSSGQIWVTLCAGQGGTPADTKQREWHDTWQVVPLAESSEFILIDVKPFSYFDYVGYHCTGFRGQEKGFDIKNSLVHIFQHVTAFNCPVLESPVPLTENVKIENRIYQVPCFYAYFIKRNILKEENGPVYRILKKAENVLNGFKEFNYIYTRICKLAGSETSAYNSDKRLVRLHVQEDEEEYIILPTLFLLDIDNLLREECTAYIGQTFLHTSIDRQSGPVKNLIWLSWTDSFAFCPLNFLQQLLPNFRVYTEECKSKSISEMDQHDDYFQFVTEQINNVFKDSEYMLTTILCHVETEYEEEMKLLATMFKIIGKTYSVNHMCVNLDYVAMVKFGVADWRILWAETADYYANQFHLDNNTVENVFKPKSLFPTCFFHDVSFWLPSNNLFDQEEMMLLLRFALMFGLEKVQLLDEHSRNGRRSCCYRLMYRSLERPLGKKLCNKIHDKVRQLLADKLQVVLR